MCSFTQKKKGGFTIRGMKREKTVLRQWPRKDAAAAAVVRPPAPGQTSPGGRPGSGGIAPRTGGVLQKTQLNKTKNPSQQQQQQQ